MKNLIFFLVFIFISISTFSQKDANIWKRYTGAINDSTIPMLPDYSYAGYRLGDKPIPEVGSLNLPFFYVTDYGAIADDNKSDQEAIQLAINAAEENNGGVVFFPPGEFLINTDSTNTRPITIKKSNIILKGSSSTPCDGTIINMVKHMQGKFKNKYMFFFHSEDKVQTVGSILTKSANRGDFVVHVKDAHKFKSKKHVKIGTTSKDSAFINKYLDNKTPRKIWSQILEEGVKLTEIHKIKSIDSLNSTITFKNPIIDDINSDINFSIKSIELLKNCGFEDIHFKGNFFLDFKHHLNYIHDSGWSAINMFEVTNSWVRRCKFSNVNNVIKMDRSFSSTLTTLVADGNRAHFLTNVSFESTGILQALIWDNTNKGQWHGADFSGRSCNSVAWRIEAPKGRGFDMHATQPRTNLVDLYNSGGIAEAGGHYTRNPNHLTGLTIWNQKRNGKTDISNYNWWNIDCNSNYCGTNVVNPIIVGMHGNTKTTFNQSNVKYEESNGAKVSPESLYEAQLEHRLGYTSWPSDAIIEYNNYKKYWYTEPSEAETCKISINIPTEESEVKTDSSKVIKAGKPLELEAIVSSGSVRNIKLYINDTLIRQENDAPYKWCYNDSIDPKLNHMKEGVYKIKFLADVNCSNHTVEKTISLVVKNHINNSETNKDTLNQNIKIHPNPLKNNLIIDYAGDFSNLEINLFDFSGRKTTNTITNNKNIDVSNISAGLYIVSIKDTKNNTIIFKRVIKE